LGKGQGCDACAARQDQGGVWARVIMDNKGDDVLIERTRRPRR
jgi:hypothetical protein